MICTTEALYQLQKVQEDEARWRHRMLRNKYP